MTTVRAAQTQVRKQLLRRFEDECVQEWRAFTEPGRHYAPRLDLAVGPFATGEAMLATRYNRMLKKHRSLIRWLWACHKGNVGPVASATLSMESATAANQNARCFLAVEIENRVSRKHLMGGVMNAAALGRLGIVVGWTPEKLKALVQVRRYLEFLLSAGKPTVAVSNLIILSKEQFLGAPWGTNL